MEAIIEKVVTGELSWSDVVLIASIAWLTQFVTWSVKQLWNWVNRRKQPNLHDSEVYKKYRDIFTQKFIEFIGKHDFEIPYRRNIFDLVEEALEYNRFQNPDFVFHDGKLEKQRQKTMDALTAFNEKILSETSCHELDSKLSCVPVRNNDPGQKERHRIISELNILASKLSSELKALNKACLKKFDQKRTPSDSSPPPG